jgi:hypothetical protein
MITLTTERYSLGELGYELDSTKVTEITEEQYINYIDSSGFGASDTVVIEDDVTVITSISPGKSIKVIRTFEV